MNQNSENTLSKPVEDYWSSAGRVGYAEAMYLNETFAEHMNVRLAVEAFEAAEAIGLDPSSKVLDLGCGDGLFANRFLASKFREVVGYDKAESAISRANSARKKNTQFYSDDLNNPTTLNAKGFDGAFLMGILHHVKPMSLKIMQDLSERVPKLVILEPNGNHILRKMLEFLPSYRAAGEESFTKKELYILFEKSGYKIVHYKRVNIFPNFTPKRVFLALRKFEPFIESSRILDRLCTSQFYGLIRK